LEGRTVGSEQVSGLFRLPFLLLQILLGLLDEVKEMHKAQVDIFNVWPYLNLHHAPQLASFLNQYVPVKEIASEPKKLVGIP